MSMDRPKSAEAESQQEEQQLYQSVKVARG
jgi:hypothetical protein